MKEITDFNKFDFKNFSSFTYDDKKITAPFGGRIYFAYKNGKLFYHKFSLFGRLAHACFGYKKEFGVKGLWEALKDKNLIKDTTYSRSTAQGKITATFKEIHQRDNSFQKMLFKDKASEEELIDHLENHPFVDINRRIEMGHTPLIEAINERKYKLVKFLLQQGADINVGDDESGGLVARTPLHYIIGERPDMAIDFIRRGANVNAKDGNGGNALHIALASESPNKELVKEILKRRSEMNVKDRFGNFPLTNAAKTGDRELVEMLLQAGARLNPSDEGRHPLYEALCEKHWELATWMIEQGAKMSSQSLVGAVYFLFSTETPMEILDKFLPQIATLPEDLKGSLLNAAVSSKQQAYLEALLKAGIDPNAKTSYGSTPLGSALEKGDHQKVELLLKAGARPNEQMQEVGVFSPDSAQGKANLPLQVAIEKGKNSIELLELLAVHKADVNLAGNFGRTALHHAVQCNNVEAVQWLLAHGAKKELEDQNKATPLDLANRWGFKEIAALLA
jgi:ankyrin repeat protein